MILSFLLQHKTSCRILNALEAREFFCWEATHDRITKIYSGRYHSQNKLNGCTLCEKTPDRGNTPDLEKGSTTHTADVIMKG